MDGATPPEPPPPTPPTPYRDGKPLAEIIPPDNRRAKAAALVISSMVAGVTLWVLGGWVLELATRVPPIREMPTTPGYEAGHIARGVLHGPGRDLVMPPVERSIIHVWLQGCQDCMPAFEAMRDVEDRGGLGVKVPIINVAYGEADPTWAARYRVDSNLVFDIGGATVVKPLGIGTFTTLVVDSNGSILHRDRPDRPGYRDRVRAAVGAENVVPDPAPEPDFVAQPDYPPLPTSQGLDTAGVERVVAAHRSEIKRACWDSAPEPKPSSINVRTSLTIGPDGKVLQTTSTGDDEAAATCIDRQVRTWVFPAPGSVLTVNIPFKFVRQ